MRFVLIAGVLWIALVGPRAEALAQTALDPARALTRIALGSCADQRLPQPFWPVVAAWRPELFIFMGDNVYATNYPGDASDVPGAYARLAAIEGFRAFRDSVPILATWDDHDYGANDGGAEFALKAQSAAAFHDFWKTPADSPRRRAEGIYDAVIVGPAGRRAQVILLDMRSFRSPLLRKPPGTVGIGHYMPDPDPAKTMLGAAQWAWLEQQLRAPAEIRLIVSSIQVLADGHGFERWGNLPAEQRRLFEAIDRADAAGVVLLSGDRHLGAIYRESGATRRPLIEMTSSSLNRPFRNAAEPGSNRLGDVYGDENFGTIDIDWTARRLELALRDLQGNPVRRHAVTFAELGAGR